jgi:hypothetical protein
MKFEIEGTYVLTKCCCYNIFIDILEFNKLSLCSVLFEVASNRAGVGGVTYTPTLGPVKSLAGRVRTGKSTYATLTTRHPEGLQRYQRIPVNFRRPNYDSDEAEDGAL